MRRFLKRWTHLIQGIIFGLLVLGITLYFFDWTWRNWVDVPSTEEGRSRFSLQLTYAQAVSAFAATLVAGTLGLYAIREFAQQQEKPELQLGVEVQRIPGSTRFLRLKNDEFSSTEIIFTLTNIGSVIAIWYMIKLELPFLTEVWYADGRGEGSETLAQTRNRSHEFLKAAVVDCYGKDSENLEPMILLSDTGITFGLSFLSHGHHAAYPHQKINLFVVRFRSWMITKDTRYKCAYTIYSASEKPVTGTLDLVIPAAVAATASVAAEPEAATDSGTPSETTPSR
jgi:hypothetical protein